ncbi:metalloendopeptidase [Ciborinia camelliae]|nr:metalloendopeptidase [Ciborinia camelliae]
MARNFSLKAFYSKPVIPIPKEGFYPVTFPNNLIGRYRANRMKKTWEKKGKDYALDPDIKNGKIPLLLFVDFSTPWTETNIFYANAIAFSPASPDGMKLWSDMHVPFFRRRWVRVTSTCVLLVGLGMSYVWFTYRQMVPITERKQLIIGSDKGFISASNSSHEKLLKEMGDYVLPVDHPTAVAIRGVFDQLLESSGLEGGSEQWEMLVVNAPFERNASVLYNKKVWIYSGLLDVAQDNNGLAVALSHEMAHVVAKHGPEKSSNVMFWGILGLPTLPLLSPVIVIEFAVPAFLYALPWIATMFYVLPSMETEADYIGLTIMARAGFDIQEAVGFWERMREVAREEKRKISEEQGRKRMVVKKGPEFLRTHPTTLLEDFRDETITDNIDTPHRIFRNTFHGQHIPTTTYHGLNTLDGYAGHRIYVRWES